MPTSRNAGEVLGLYRKREAGINVFKTQKRGKALNNAIIDNMKKQQVKYEKDFFLWGGSRIFYVDAVRICTEFDHPNAFAEKHESEKCSYAKMILLWQLCKSFSEKTLSLDVRQKAILGPKHKRHFSNTNANNYSQILKELKQQCEHLEDVYYDKDALRWVTKYNFGKLIEHDTFIDCLDFILL